MRTSQLHNQDRNNSFSSMGVQRYDIIKSMSNKRSSAVKSLLVNPLLRNPITSTAPTVPTVQTVQTVPTVPTDSKVQIDSPMMPVDVAAKRADRIALEKMKHTVSSVRYVYKNNLHFLYKQN